MNHAAVLFIRLTNRRIHPPAFLVDEPTAVGGDVRQELVCVAGGYLLPEHLDGLHRVTRLPDSSHTDARLTVKENKQPPGDLDRPGVEHLAGEVGESLHRSDSNRLRGYLIKFDFPEGVMWAGWAGDALGWAPTEKTAARFETKEIAENTLANSYGAGSQRYGLVVSEWTVRPWS